MPAGRLTSEPARSERRFHAAPLYRAFAATGAALARCSRPWSRGLGPTGRSLWDTEQAATASALHPAGIAGWAAHDVVLT